MKNYLSKSEVAERYRVSERTINHWMRRRGLPYFQIGKRGRVRFDPDELDRWDREHHVPQ